MTGDVHALPVPWQHFVALLDKAEAKKASSIEDYITQRLMQLIDTMIQAKYHLSSAAIEASLKDPTDAPPGKQKGGFMGSGGSGMPSFNLLITKSALHLIPRRTEEFELQGEWKQVNAKQLGVMSVNAMGECAIAILSSARTDRPTSNRTRFCWHALGQAPFGSGGGSENGEWCD